MILAIEVDLLRGYISEESDSSSEEEEVIYMQHVWKKKSIDPHRTPQVSAEILQRSGGGEAIHLLLLLPSQ